MTLMCPVTPTPTQRQICRMTQAQKSRLSQRPGAASSPAFAADLRSSADIDMSLVRRYRCSCCALAQSVRGILQPHARRSQQRLPLLGVCASACADVLAMCAPADVCTGC